MQSTKSLTKNIACNLQKCLTENTACNLQKSLTENAAEREGPPIPPGRNKMGTSLATHNTEQAGHSEDTLYDIKSKRYLITVKTITPLIHCKNK